MVVEVVGGVISGSLALLADAGHMLTDAIALGLAYVAFRLGRRVADSQRTFGYARFEEGDVVRHELVRRIVMAYEDAARKERDEREARLAALPAPDAPVEGDADGLKRMLSRERPR